MTDKEIMYHRFSREHMKKHTGLLAEMLGMSRQDYEAAVRRGMAEEAAELRSKQRCEGELNEVVEHEEGEGRRVLTREEFINIVRNELQSYGDCYLADRIIAAADKYAEGRTRWIPVSERLPEKNVRCLVAIGRFNFTEIAMCSDLMGTIDHRIFYQGDYGHQSFRNITQYVKAWMPLPTPYEPQESEEV